VDARDVVLLIAHLSRLEDDEWDARARPPMRVVLVEARRRDDPPQTRVPDRRYDPTP
jgi:hypothetical protein